MKVGGYIYIMSNQAFGTVYIGVTDDLWRRIWEHKTKIRDCFTKQYDLTMLVYYEEFGTIQEATQREKQLKAWKRNWKLRLIMDKNPQWNDLYNDFCHRYNMDPDLRQDITI